MRTLSLALLVCATPSLAQYAPDRFHPAVSAEGILDVPSGEVGEHLDADAGLVLDGSLGPDRVGAHLVAALSLLGWMRLGVDLPAELAPGALDGLRLDPRLGLLRRADAGLDMSFALGLFAAPRGPAVHPELAASVFLDETYLRLNSAFGYRFLPGAAEMTVRVGARWETGRWADDRFGALYPADMEASLVGAAPFDAELATGTTLEGKLGLGYTFGSLRVGVAAGFGILRGGGAPDLRALAQLRWSDRVRDRDDDGIPDADDACPRAAEDRDRYRDWDGCPDPDNDEDGVPDVVDGCSLSPEDLDGDRDEDGCPDP